MLPGILLDFALLALVYAALYTFRLKKRPVRYRVWFTLLYIYLCIVLCVTLMPFSIPIPGSRALTPADYNLEPFRDIKRGYLYARSGVALNCLMFMPLGFLLPTLKRRGFLRVTLAGFGASLCIECVQLLYCWGGVANSRIFDVTDIIMNTLGALLGYALFRLAKRKLVQMDEDIP